MSEEILADLRRGWEDLGLSAGSIEKLAKAVRPMVAVIHEPVEDEATIPAGSSKAGGRPDLPPGAPWPSRLPYPDYAQRVARLLADAANPAKTWSWASKEQRREFQAEAQRRAEVSSAEMPLAFIAQLDLAEVAAVDSLDVDLPRTGVLSLFYDVLDMPWGFDPGEGQGFRIVYSTGPVERRDLPELLLDPTVAPLLSPQRCTLAPGLSTIPVGSLEWPGLEISDEDAELLEFDEPEHDQVGGWPTVIQGEMRTECALVRAGHYCGDAEAYRDPALADVRATAIEWVLLWQIASSDDIMWGDSGYLYVWIRRDDLAAHRFDRAHVVLQCS